ncbi:hypothetical protein SSBR45G_69000 [Bradyrhizobium sp. SSBR45G]|uniref:hypothetical protein n=1 Tax=unclassified Bradyrhizobium TaxID=2631580 RepID=UPI002342A3A8|nr:MULTISPECIES: hypothetical protein [unclassified Bradyrhizobium]GLH81991.1 hypothetical protein SSBR45G_69000 [Bradyrhizobium sp. SSBR45G]GLH85363.1 hypothetical protein SSBR45R_28230 [Bradyrhizobium sp. SSBR45R]
MSALSFTQCALRWLLLSVSLATVAGMDGLRAEIPSTTPSATPSPAAPPQPFSVSGWRSQRPSGTDVTFFICEDTKCGPGSKVSYRLYAPDTTMTIEQFRASQEQTVKILDQRVPGQTTTILGVEGDKGTNLPRVFRARRLKVAADGSREYQVSGMLFGLKASASLISTAGGEASSTTNFALFAIPVLAMLGLPPR